MPDTIYSVDYLDLMPESMKQDKAYVAMAKATAKEKKRIANMISTVLIWPEFQNIREDMMEVLRYDLGIDSEDFVGTEEEKRSMLQNAMIAHRYAGTIGAVKKALSAIVTDVEIMEWFQYGGRPYHFRVKAENSEGNESEMRRILKLVESNKNLRSVMESVSLGAPKIETEQNVYYGGAICGYHTTPMPVTDIRIGEVGVFDDFILDESAMT